MKKWNSMIGIKPDLSNPYEKTIKKWQKISIVLILIVSAMVLVTFLSPPLRSAITQIAGLAVAQTPIQWNPVKDAAVGDAQTNGLIATGNYVYDATGATWNRMRGSASGVMSVSLPSTGVLTLLNAVAAPTTGASNDVAATFPTDMTWEVEIAGVLANQTTNLEGSINNTDWYILDASTTTTAEMRHVALKPILYIRGNTTVVGAGGGDVTVRFVGKGN